MSIASEITRISTNVENAYSAANAKGATMPVSQNSDNLANTILSIPQSGGAVIDSLSITPTTSAQTITAPTGLDGYNPISVSAVTSSIDANIVAGNIKKDVSILGVTGSYEGVTPSGTLSITTNGTYDVTNYASAAVSVSGSGPTYYGVKELDSNNVLKNNGISSLSGVDDLGPYCAAYAYYGDNNDTGPLTINVDMSSLTKITGEGACQYMVYNHRSSFSSANIVEINIDMSNVKTISGKAACQYMCSTSNFTLKSAKVSVDLSSLETISGDSAFYYAFQGFNSISNYSSQYEFPKLTSITSQSVFSFAWQSNSTVTSISFPVLESFTQNNVFSSAFSSASKLQVVRFDKLSSLGRFGSTSSNSPFNNCKLLTDVYFGGLKASSFTSAVNQFQYLFTSSTGSTATGGTTLHLPTNLDPESADKTFDITTLTGYPTFGGSASYIHLAYDLPATE